MTAIALGAESAWLLPALPALAFAVLALAALTGHSRMLLGGAWLSILAVALSFLLVWPVGADVVANGAQELSLPWVDVAGTQLSISLILDPLSVLMLGLVTFVALCVQVYSIGYMHGEAHYTWYFAAHSLFAAAMLTLVLAGNLLLLYIAWELVGFCSYLLIGFYYDRRSAAEAAKKAFVTTRLGDVGLLIGILLLFGATGSFQIAEVFRAIEGGGLSGGVLTLTAFLLFLGAMGKSAQFPLHVWLPDAMEGPTPVSALIHAATMVAAGVYLVARMYPLYEAAPAVLSFITVIGLITTLLAASIALVATDIKKVIAYSTVSKLGFMMVVLGAGGAGFTAAIFYLITHGFFKALLFLGAGSVIHATGRQELDELRGLGRRMPWTAGLFLVAGLALAGVPPLSGFWSKDEALLVLSHGNPLVYGLALLSVLMSSLYMGRLWLRLFLGEASPVQSPRPEAVERHAHEAPPVMLAPMLALGMLSALGGLVALPNAGRWLGLPGGLGEFLYVHEPEAYHADLVVMGVSVLISLAGLVIAAGFYWRGAWSATALRERFAGLHTFLERKAYLDDVYQWLIDRVALMLGRFIAFFDRAVVNDVGINGPGALAVAVGEVLRRSQTGQLPNYALGMAIGVLVIAAAVSLLL